MANPAADFPTALHSATDVSGFGSSTLGSTTPTHTDLEGKQEQEILAVQTKLGINSSTPDANMLLVGVDSGESEWQGASDITTETSPAAGDFLLLFTAEGDLVKVDWDDLPAGGGGMDDFILDADTGTPQTVEDGETLTITGGTGIDTSVGATNEVTIDLDSSTQASLALADTALQDLSDDTSPQLGGNLDLNGFNLLSDSTPGSDHSVSGGFIAQFTANENQAFGDACYINTDGEMQLADADAIASGLVVAICVSSTVTANNTGNYVFINTGAILRDDSWAWTVGGAIYLSTSGTTGNTLTQTAPTGEDDVVLPVGVATHGDRMLFVHLAPVEYDAA